MSMALSLCRGEEERGERTVTSAICGIHVSANIPYSGKLSREKTFANFAVLWQFVKVFSMKFGAWCSLVRPKRAMRESFLRKNRIFHQFAKVFSFESFPLYSKLTSLQETLNLLHTCPMWLLNNNAWSQVTAYTPRHTIVHTTTCFPTKPTPVQYSRKCLCLDSVVAFTFHNCEHTMVPGLSCFASYTHETVSVVRVYWPIYMFCTQ